jgi:hypothetical protein
MLAAALVVATAAHLPQELVVAALEAVLLELVHRVRQTQAAVVLVVVLHLVPVVLAAPAS